MDLMRFVEDATKVYIQSYNTSMEIVKNPSMAMQIAQSIVCSYMIVFKPDAAAQPSAADMLMAAIMHGVGAAVTSKQDNEAEYAQSGGDEDC